MSRVNRAAFEKLIAEDIAWLEQRPRTLERDHILAILRDSPRVYYETHDTPPAFQNITPA